MHVIYFQTDYADYTNLGDYADAWLIEDCDKYLIRDLSIIGRFRSPKRTKKPSRSQVIRIKSVFIIASKQCQDGASKHWCLFITSVEKYYTENVAVAQHLNYSDSGITPGIMEFPSEEYLEFSRKAKLDLLRQYDNPTATTRANLRILQ